MMERFDFSVAGQQVSGTASFGRAAKQIVDGRLSEDRISFRTNLDDRDFHYRGEIGEAQISFILDNQNEPPTKFVIARSPEEARRLRPRQPTGGTDPKLVSIDRGPYELEQVRSKVSQLQLDIRQCYLAAEFDPIDHAYVDYLLKIAPDGTLKEVEFLGTAPRSTELDRCMGQVFQRMNWGAYASGERAEIRLGFKALPAWRSQ
jgi:hypothetical protein